MPTARQEEHPNVGDVGDVLYHFDLSSAAGLRDPPATLGGSSTGATLGGSNASGIRDPPPHWEVAVPQ